MDIFGILAVLHLFAILVVLTRYPQMSVGVQLLGIPVIGLGLSSLGIGIGAVIVVLGMNIYALMVGIFREDFEFKFSVTLIEVGTILLFIWIAVTLTYTPSPIYGTSKLVLALLIILPCVVITKLYCDSYQKLISTCQCIGGYSIFIVSFFALYVALNYTGDSVRLRGEFFGPLSLGYITSSSLPFILILYATSEKIALRILALIAICLSVYILMATGSRGPFVALFIAAIVSLVRAHNFYRALLVTVVIAVSLSVYVNYALEKGHKGVERILQQTDGNERSTEGRFYLYGFAVEQFAEYPVFGQGVGSFSDFVQQRDSRIYAHNSVLEIAGELGLVGLTIYLLTLLAAIIQIARLRLISLTSSNKLFWAIAGAQMLFIVGMVNSFASYDLPLQRTLFVGFGMLAGTYAWSSVPGKTPN